MSKIKRVFLIVLDSFGIGQLPDAALYGDAGSNTLAAVASSPKLNIPNMQALGLYNIAGVMSGQKVKSPTGSFARLAEKSKGKDTTIGHWELAGIISSNPMPTYPGGFPHEVVKALEAAWGRKLICNRPYSGTAVIADYGVEHLQTGALIVYTSADSVLQIAAHENIVPLEELYAYCRQARELMQEEHGVGRIIARPFIGEPGSFARTANRHDFSLEPPAPTMLDALSAKGLEVIGVGKIGDIFAGKGVGESIPTKGNTDGMNAVTALIERSFKGLCFVNLVDFDMLYGHRNDVDGYANALSEFDAWLGATLNQLRSGDVLLITADHGCDPSSPGTDHSREYVPLLICGPSIKKGVDLGTRSAFADIAATVQDMFGITPRTAGESFLKEIKA